RGHEVLCYNASWFGAKIAPTGADFRAYPEPIPTARLHRGAPRDHPRLADARRDEQAPGALHAGRGGARAPRPRDLRFAGDMGLPRGAHVAHPARLLADPFRARWVAAPDRSRRDGALEAAPGAALGKDVAGGITEYGDLNLVFTSRAFHPPNRSLDGR